MQFQKQRKIAYQKPSFQIQFQVVMKLHRLCRRNIHLIRWRDQIWIYWSQQIPNTLR